MSFSSLLDVPEAFGDSLFFPLTTEYYLSIVLWCDKGLEDQAPRCNWTYNLPKELKGWQDKNGIEWESSKVVPTGSQIDDSMPADLLT